MGKQWTLGDSARRRAATRRARPARDKALEVARRRIRTGVTVNQLATLAGCSRDIAREVLGVLLDRGECGMFVRSARDGGNRYVRGPRV